MADSTWNALKSSLSSAFGGAKQSKAGRSQEDFSSWVASEAPAFAQQYVTDKAAAEKKYLASTQHLYQEARSQGLLDAKGGPGPNFGQGKASSSAADLYPNSKMSDSKKKVAAAPSASGMLN